MKAGVYCITNELNGRQYIGSTTYLERRIPMHFSELRNSKHKIEKFQNDFNDNGGFYFSCCILELVPIRTENFKYALRKAESNWIFRLNPAYNRSHFKPMNNQLVLRLALELNRGSSTIVKYLDSNHPSIQTEVAQRIIKQYA